MAANNSAGNGDAIDIRQIFNILRYRKRVVLAMVTAGLAGVCLYLFLARPVYTATTEIRIESGQKSFVIAPVLPGTGLDIADIGSEVRLLLSSSIALRVIRTLDLASDPEFSGQGSGGKQAAGNAWHMLSSPAVMARKVSGYIGLASPADPKKDGVTDGEDPARKLARELERVTRNFLERLDVRRVGLTHSIAISFSAYDPQKAARIANAVASAYLADRMETRYLATRQASDWLGKRLEKLRATVREGERAVALYRVQHGLVGDSEKTPYGSGLKKLGEELVLARIGAKEKQARLDQAREVIRAKGKLLSIDAVAQSGNIKKLRAELARVAGRIAELSTRLTARHPKLLNARGERRALEKQVQLEAGRIVQNLKNDHNIARRRVVSIGQALKKLGNRAGEVRTTTIRLKELEREAAASKAIYRTFLDRFKQTSGQQGFGTGRARVISKAVPPPRASHPKTGLSLVLALAGSLAAGAFLVFLLEHLDTGFRTAGQVRQSLGLPVLALVAKSGTGAGAGTDIGAMRDLKVGLARRGLAGGDSQQGAMSQVVLVTSALHGEGKTALATGFARHMAGAGSGSGRRTLLVDCNLHTPLLAGETGDGNSPGLVGLLSGQASYEQAVTREAGCPDFLCASPVSENPEDLLGSASMQKLLEGCRAHYDTIVLDALPVFRAVDSTVLARHVDAVVLVVEWNRTPQEAVRQAVQKLGIPQEKLAGVVLDRVDMARLAVYGGSGHGYCYGAG